MRRRESNPAEGGRALQKKKGNSNDVAVCCFSDVDKAYAWSSYTRAMRLTSHDTYWSVVVEGVSCANNIRGSYKRGANRQITIPEQDFHITALLIK
eukprot:13064311-Alexandrium_andersonii.AAC.1